MTHTATTKNKRADPRERSRRLCEEIKSAIDYRTFYAEFCPGARVVGNRLQALCPIPNHGHSGVGSPSLSVDLARGLFHCFSRNEGGDCVRFYELMHGVGFSRAVRELAARLGIESNPRSRSAARAQKPLRVVAAPDAEAELVPPDPHLTACVCDEFLRLCSVEDQHEGRSYLLRRGISEEAISRARVQYFPRRAYARVMRGLRLAFDSTDLQRTGLFNQQEHLTFYRHRLLFPFYRDGRAIYLQARTTAPGVEPRWHNMRGAIPALYTVESPAALSRGEIIYLVEGFTDTLTLITHGFTAFGLVGAGGLREEWLPAFDGFRVVSVLDPDAAGERATERYTEMFARRGTQLAHVRLPNDVNEFFRLRASAALELTLLTEIALEKS